MNLPFQGRERMRKLCALSKTEGARDVFEPPGHPPREERMAAAFLAVPRRHPHHDDP